jgi:hypothetical protein
LEKSGSILIRLQNRMEDRGNEKQGGGFFYRTT